MVLFTSVSGQALPFVRVAFLLGSCFSLTRNSGIPQHDIADLGDILLQISQHLLELPLVPKIILLFLDLGHLLLLLNI